MNTPTLTHDTRRSSSLARLISPRSLVGLGLTLICLAALAASARLPSLQEALVHVSPAYLGPALLLSSLTVVFKAARWKLLYPNARQLDIGLAVSATAIGQLANWAFPARMGEVVRVGLVTRKGPDAGIKQGAATAVGVLAAEKTVDVVMLLVAIGLFAIVGGAPAWLSKLSVAVAAVGSMVVVAGALLARNSLRRQELMRWPRPFSKIIALSAKYGQLTGDGLVGWITPWRVAQIAFLSLAVWSLGGGINYLMLRAVGIDEGLGASMAVLIAVYGGAAIPSVPGRIGVFQYLCIVALTTFAVPFEQALAFSLVLYVSVYLPPIVLALLSMVLIRSSAGLPGTAWSLLRKPDAHRQ